MNLIDQLITAKKTQKEIPLIPLIKELIKYEKLSKMDKFKHIADSPMLQKQMPIAWSAFTGNAESYWLLSETATILQNVSPVRMVIFDDIYNYKTEREQKQLRIIGNINQYPIRYYELSSTPTDNKDLIYITEVDGDFTNVTAIQQTPDSCNIYAGSIPNTIIAEPKSKTEIKPYEHNDVSITSYSNQGNNNYYFAKIHQYRVKMPTSNTLEYFDGENKINKQLSDTEVRTLHMRSNDPQYLASLIEAHYPTEKDGD